MGDKSVAQKLGLKPGSRMLVRRAPRGLEAMLGTLPEGVELVSSGDSGFPLILFFAPNRAVLVEEIATLKTKLDPGGALWIAYYKGTSDKRSDINRDSIRDHAQMVGLDTVAQVALDDDWSALRLKVV